MRRKLIALIAVAVLAGATAQPTRAEEGAAERIGQQIDQKARQIAGELRQAWAEVRQNVNGLGVQGRVYGRLYWDQDLHESAIDVEVRDGDVVVLKGSVPDAAAKAKAGQLAADTVGVRQVVDELGIASAPN